MKKVILTLLLSALFFMSLAGCSGNGTPPVSARRSDGWKDFQTVDEHNIEKVVTAPNFTLDESIGFDTTAFYPAGVVSDHMVLQRNAVNCLWGATSFDGPFAVRINGVTCYGTAEDNRFEIYLSPMEAGGPYDMVFYCESGKMSIKDVLIGDVLLFSGQSNMEWTMRDTMTLGKQYVYEGNPAIGGAYIPTAAADPVTYEQYIGTEEIRQQYRDMANALREDNSSIRLCNPRDGLGTDLIGRNTSAQEDLVCEWRAASVSDDSITSSSMFAYLFAKRLQEAAQIPVGVMMCAVGGTNVPAWCPRDVVNQYSADFVYGNNEGAAENAANGIARCYNTFIAPLQKFTFRSVVWYQGEGQSARYALSMKHLIDCWREIMDAPGMSFLIVELPMYGNGDGYQTGYTAESYREADVYTGMEGKNYFPCRTEQQKITELVDACALSVSINTGDYDDIHPSDKRVIASQACDKYIEAFYGSEELLSGPELVQYARDGENVLLYFANVGDGLEVRNGGCNFQISEDGTTWYEVYAEKNGKNSAILSAAGTPVSKINRVRYGALNYPRVSRLDMSGYVSLFNSGGYPCDQFEIEIDQ